MRPSLLAKSREGVPSRVDRHDGTRSELAHDNPHADLLVLQGMAGNRAVTHLLASDAVRARARAGVASVAAPLHPDVRTEMEARFGCDFGSIRVHQDSTAAQTAQAIHARAYTVGEDIVFGEGEYSPQAMEGRKLLAHELAHVVQQRRGGSLPPALPFEPGTALESDADRAANTAVEGAGTVNVALASAQGVALQSEGWSEWAARQAREWRDWAFGVRPLPPTPKPGIDSLYGPENLPPGAVPRNQGAYHDLPDDQTAVPQHTPEDAAEQMRRRQPVPPGHNEATAAARPGDPLDSAARRTTSQAVRTPQAAPPTIDPADAPTQIISRAQRERIALNSALANPEMAEVVAPQRRWIRRGRSLRRGSATVGGMVFTAIAVGTSIYFLSRAENLEDLIARSEELAVDAVVGAALFRLMGPASAFLSLA